jgi:hypothetical protein
MKKLIMLSMITLIVSAGFIGCTKDDEKTTLRWKNTDAAVASGYTGIRWNNSATTQIDTEWTGVPDENQFTAAKEVNALAGTGEVLASGGATADIVIDTANADQAGVVQSSSSSATLATNTDATLVIQGVQAKK